MGESEFCVLHLGDLHVPEDSWNDDQGNELLREIVDRASLSPPDVIVCTGDVGDRGSDRSIELGFKWLSRLRSELSRRLRNRANFPATIPMIVVPGNHDTVWPTSWRQVSGWNARRRTSSFRKHVKLLGSHTIRCPLTPSERQRAFSELSSGRAKNWFFYSSNSRSGVLILPLSSVEYGAGLHHLTEQSDKMIKLSAVLGRAKATAFSGLAKVSLDDMPYIHDDFLGRLRDLSDPPLFDNWDSKFRSALKIAVVHHPLLPVAGEQELRAFDVVSNGAAAFNILASLGFHLVLYGHKHVFGTRIHRGSEVETVDRGTPLADRSELLAVVGGLLGSKGRGGQRGFQFLKIKSSSAYRSWRDVELTRVLKRPSLPGPIEHHSLCTVDEGGKFLWLGSLSRNHGKARVLSRSCSLVSCLEDAIDVFARTPDALARHKGDVVKAVESALTELSDFLTEGPRGVNEAFQNEVFASAEKGDCLAFVDHGGRSTWYHEDLLGFLARLSRIFQERNGQHRTQRYSEFLVRKLEERGSRELALPIPKKAPSVGLTLVRVLVWEEEDLRSPAGKSLTKFHDVFGIPLLWCDPKELRRRGILKNLHCDFHLEWLPHGHSPRRRVKARPIDKSDVPDRVWYFDDEGQRTEATSEDRGVYWETFLAMLRRSSPAAQKLKLLGDEL